MAHAQQQIITALQALLAAGGTVAGARVYADPVDPLPPANLPAIVLEEQGEQIDPYTIHGIVRRDLAVRVHCVITHSSTAVADARAFGLAVEKLITTASTTLDTLCSQGITLAASRPTADGDTDRLLAARVQDWRFGYLTAATTPETIL